MYEIKIGDGALLPSPTREKLEPVILRRRDEPKEHKDEAQTKSKPSPKSSPRAVRSQSLGPSRSPKRQTQRASSITKEYKVQQFETTFFSRTNLRFLEKFVIQF